MSSTHILYNDGSRCGLYVITLFTHTHTRTHIYPLGKKNKNILNYWVMVINLQNCMQDVKQGSHPLFSLKILHEALYIVVLLFIHENSDRGVRSSYCRSSEKHSGFTRYYECQLYKIKGNSADFNRFSSVGLIGTGSVYSLVSCLLWLRVNLLGD